jgi:hypothetical protein
MKKPHGKARCWRNMMRIYTELNKFKTGSSGEEGCEHGDEFVDSVIAGTFFNQNNP